jgi:hypothetical protein
MAQIGATIKYETKLSIEHALQNCKRTKIFRGTDLSWDFRTKVI